MSEKTLSYLYSRGRNRFAKVVYIFLYGIVLLIIFGVNNNSPFDYGDFFIGVLITVAIFELMRRAFYYISLGKIKPEK